MQLMEAENQIAYAKQGLDNAKLKYAKLQTSLPDRPRTVNQQYRINKAEKQLGKAQKKLAKAESQYNRLKTPGIQEL